MHVLHSTSPGFIGVQSVRLSGCVAPRPDDKSRGARFVSAGRSSSAFKTIQKAIDTASAGEIIEVADGVYYESLSVSKKGTSTDAQLWLRAENPGGVILSGAVQAAREGTEAWSSEGNDTWSTSRSDDVWAAYHLDDGTFLPRFKTRADIEAVTVNLHDSGKSVKTPSYGVAHEGGKLYLRLKDGGDPNGQKIVVPRAWHVQVLSVSATPHFHLDGFWIEAGGDQSGSEAAVTFDANSQGGSIINCVSTLQRTLARVPSNFRIRWTEHFFPGFKELADDFRSANGNPGTVNHIWDYVKNYNRNAGTGTGGNAYYEGSIYRSVSTTASTAVSGEYLYVHEIFDGLLLGETRSSSVANSVFDYCYDDCIELESNQNDSDGSRLEVHENLFLNSSVVWLSRRSPKSGPIFAYRNVLKPNDPPHGRGSHMIKTGGTATMYVYFNTLIKLDGMDHGTAHLGWGSNDTVTWNNDVSDIHFRNNAIIFESGLQGSQPPLGGDTDYNLFYSDGDLPALRGSGGVFVDRTKGTSAIGFANYGQDWTPQGTQLVGQAGPIPKSWAAPDNGWSQTDIGCFQTSNVQPSQWPRPYDRSNAYSRSTKHFESPRKPPPGWK